MRTLTNSSIVEIECRLGVYLPALYRKLQEMWVIDFQAETAASISHETVPEDWPNEEWLICEAWEEQYL
jgi:hypothetical protein